MSFDDSAAGRRSTPVALQRCDQFVGRTTNWLYDHLRHVPRYRPAILCEELLNRDEFPELEAWRLNSGALHRRVWHRLAGARLHPLDRWRLGLVPPRLVHSHFGETAVDDLPFQAALAVPWIVSFYGADAYQTTDEERTRRLYAPVFVRAALVLTLGPSMRDRLEKLGCPAPKLVIHPLGVDVRALPHRPRVLTRDQHLKVLFAGTLREKKGPEYLVEAIGLLAREGAAVDLMLVGDTTGKPGDAETKARVLQGIHRYGIQERVRLLPHMSFADLVRLALDCHVFVAPSVTAADGDAEGTPFVLQQMMATEMPVISTWHSDIPYILGPLTNLLAPERDAPALAQRLQRYLDHPTALTDDGVAVRERILTYFDVRQCSVRLADLYDRALGRPTTGREITSSAWHQGP